MKKFLTILTSLALVFSLAIANVGCTGGKDKEKKEKDAAEKKDKDGAEKEKKEKGS